LTKIWRSPFFDCLIAFINDNFFPKSRPTISKEVSVEVQATEDMKTLVYQVLGRGDVLISKTIDVPNRKTQVFKFLAGFSMVPKANLIVYYIRGDGEIVSDRVEIEFGDELNNFVKLELSTLQASPGQNLDITINTNPNSFVGLLGVDQSVLLLKKGNDLTKDSVFNELKEYDSTNSPDGPYYRRKRFVRYPWRPVNKHFDVS
jgi:CD109 antigen